MAVSRDHVVRVGFDGTGKYPIVAGIFLYNVGYVIGRDDGRDTQNLVDETLGMRVVERYLVPAEDVLNFAEDER